MLKLTLGLTLLACVLAKAAKPADLDNELDLSVIGLGSTGKSKHLHDHDCVLKAQAEYKTCFAKAQNYKNAIDRKAAIQLCDEILDNDSAECRQLTKADHKLADPACVATAKAEHAKCSANALKYPPGNNRKAAIQLCNEILDNDSADCRQLTKADHKLTHSGCIAQVQDRHAKCYSDSLGHSSESEFEAAYSQCEALQDSGMVNCLVEHRAQHLQANPACINKARADYFQCLASAAKIREFTTRYNNVQNCGKEYQDKADVCEGRRPMANGGAQVVIDKEEPANLPNNFCVNQARGFFDICYNNAYKQSDQNAIKFQVNSCKDIRNAALKRCGVNFSSQSSGNDNSSGPLTGPSISGGSVVQPQPQPQSGNPIIAQAASNVYVGKGDFKPDDQSVIACYQRADIRYRNCLYVANIKNDEDELADKVKKCEEQRTEGETVCENFRYSTSDQLGDFNRAQKDEETNPDFKNLVFSQCASAANTKAVICRRGALYSRLNAFTKDLRIKDCEAVRNKEILSCKPIAGINQRLLGGDKHMSWCQFRALASKVWCLTQIKVFNKDDARNSESQRCEYNYALSSAKCGKRRLAQTRAQCLKSANENFVKCQMEVTKLSDWTAEQKTAKAAAKTKCREEYDHEQDDCDFKPKAYQSPILTTRSSVIA